jgi:O-methyltransferase involved in polyketide biosynthesis
MSDEIMSIDDDGARISPTAHYTAAVWARSGLSNPALSTWLGAILHAAFAPVNEVYGRLSGGTSLDAMLLARHRALDALLERAVVAGRVGQVVEIAAGLSGRGCRFARRFPDLHYIETDLPAMAAHKRHTLDEAGLRGANHDVRSLDALASDGPSSLAAVAAALDSSRGLAIVTEGLLSYLARDAVLQLWRRIATTLGRFPHGLYLSDLHLTGDLRGMWGPELFRIGLGLFARGPVRHHFAAAREAVDALTDAGFGDACLYYPDDVVSPDCPGRGSTHFVRLLAAETRADGGHA